MSEPSRAEELAIEDLEVAAAESRAEDEYYEASITTRHTMTTSCDQADHEYGTLRVMGSTGFDLMQHAEECEQEKWHHALPTELWPTVERRRGQALGGRADRGTRTVADAARFEAKRGWADEFRNPTPEDGPEADDE